ncbi:MAG: nitroreductase family protein [Selenomonadaceae bacterium]|nr:nitroreductase family protein [Selenomonadaceae bacterium]
MRCFQEAVINRRTNYALGKNIPVLPSQIVATVERMTKEVPSAFNMQSARVVLAMGEHHEKVWSITKETLRRIVPADRFEATAAKIDGFAAGYGTVLFFEETATVKDMQEQFKPYADNFPVWASQANGMLQFAIWTQLANLGLGVNIQHYNPLIDADIKAHFSVPESWQLVAQMVFGELLAVPQPIEKISINERVKVFG